MSRFELAEINIGRLLAPIDHPMIADFKNNLDRINELAEGSDGFIWRLTGEGNDATDLVAFDDPAVITNMSTWRDMDALAAYVYRSDHRTIMRRRAEWFDKMEVYMALWWVPAGHRPTPAEGRARIELMARLGPSPEAFTFKNPFPSPDATPIKPVLESCE